MIRFSECWEEQQVEMPAVGAKVAHPLAVAPGRHEVLLAAEGQEVDRHLARLPGLAAGDLEHPTAPHAHAEAGEPCDRAVEHVPGEPSRLLVVRRGGLLAR